MEQVLYHVALLAMTAILIVLAGISISIFVFIVKLWLDWIRDVWRD